MSRSYLPLPPLHEQAAIVRYLDHADRRIRHYINAKRKLIPLLEEEKQAIINQAVTRGLDPNVPLKPSGVEWLGDVPEHWERRRLKTILQPVDRRSTSGGETLLSLRRDYGVVVYAEHFVRPSQTLVGFKLECRSTSTQPTFPILGVFRLKGQPKRDGSTIVRSCKASQSPVCPIRDAFAVVEHPSCPVVLVSPASGVNPH